MSGDTSHDGLLNPGETFVYSCSLAALPDGDATVNTVTVVGTVDERTLNGDGVFDPADGLAPITKTASATVSPTPIPVTLLKKGVNCDVGQPICVLPGGEFRLYGSDPSLPGAGAGILLTQPMGGDGATFVTTPLTVNHTYWLVETKAPAGFQLLAQPVKFTLTRPAVTLDPASASTFITIDPNDAHTIVITDVPAADLPKVGGDGPFPFLAGGLLLLLGAGAYLLKTSGPRSAPRRVTP